MPDFQMRFLDKEWYFAVCGATTAMIQGMGDDTQFSINEFEPEEGIAGFDLHGDHVLPVPDLGALGGCLWVRSTTGRGAIRLTHDSSLGLPYVNPGYVDDTYVEP